MHKGAEPITPFLRWAGSKRAMLPYLKRFMPFRFNKYIEPFAGCGCLFFDIRPEKAVLGDLNSELIRTYHAVIEHPIAVANRLASMPTGRSEYYKIRERGVETLSDAERAAQFIYLNRFCFNGLYRTNRNGKFNVPYGAPKTANVPSAKHLKICASALRKATVEHSDFEKLVLKHAHTGDFVYLDPPFYRSDVRTFVEYNASPFSGGDLARLCTLLDTLLDRRANFLLSYAYCEEALEAFAKYEVTIVLTHRSISGASKHRGLAKEILVRGAAG